MKQFINYNLLILSVIIGFSSCSEQQNSITNSQNQEKNNFLTMNVPKNFDWNMQKELSFSIIPNDQYNGLYFYKIGIYSSDPINQRTNNLLTEQYCKQGKNLEGTITIPTDLNVVYIKQTTPSGKISIKKIRLSTTNQLTCSFIPNTTNSRNILKTNRALLVDETYLIPANKLEVNTQSELEQAKKGKTPILIKSNADVLLDNFSGIDSKKQLFIQGILTVETDKDIKLDKLIVLSGGALIFKKKGNKKEVKIKVNTMAFQENSIFTTEMSLNFEETHLINNSKITLTNNAAIKLEKEKAQFSNFGSFICDHLLLNHSTLEMGTGSYLEIRKTTQIDDKVEIRMRKNSIINSNLTLFNKKETKITNLDAGTMAYFGMNQFILEEGSNASTVTVSGGVFLAYKEGLCWDKKVYDKKPKLEIPKYLEEITDEALNTFQQELDNKQAAFNDKEQRELANKFNNGYTINSNTVIATSSYYQIPIAEQIQCAAKIPVTESHDGINANEVEVPQEINYPVLSIVKNPTTFIMEDLYPHKGDYDMNDLVIQLDSISEYKNNESKIEKCKFHFTLIANGGKKNIGAALRFIGIEKTNIKNVVYSLEQAFRSDFILENGLEANQGNDVVLPFFNNTHDLFGTPNMVNTGKGSTIAPIEFSVEIEFNTPNLLEINERKLDFFGIYMNQLDRTEIHAPGVNGTNLDKGQFTSIGYAVWAFNVPLNSFLYPKENISIDEAYPKFKIWVESNKTEAIDWYHFPITDKVMNTSN